ncbi:PREDICTED: alpha-tocopherol transfer protein-like, partial [Wasmannia auropunctata]|uniref:alpha-tocopherol transfer protein-like n=1 Tax=Wasmannia auropunctata TaxID=64793 RepID=UPI0005F0530A
LFLPLRKLDNQGRLIIIVRSTRHDPRIHKVPDIVKISIMLIELAMKNNVTASVYGCAMFYDVIDPTLRHIFQFRPYILMNMIHTWQSCYPIRIRSMNMINAPAFVDVTVKIIKSFMTEKMKSRFHIYSHMSLSCFKDIPANILPIEYGGTDGTIQELTGNCDQLKF